jgi:hypothetical protein
MFAGVSGVGSATVVSSQCLDGVMLIGVDAELARDGKRASHDGLGIQR